MQYKGRKYGQEIWAGNMDPNLPPGIFSRGTTFLTRNYIPLMKHFTPIGSLTVITKLLQQSEALLCRVSTSNGNDL